MSTRPARVVVTIIMDALIACAVLVALRIAVRFSGQFAAHHWGKVFVEFTSFLVIPFGFHAIRTPYGGVFDVSAALMVVVYLLIEWVVAGINSRT